MIRQQQYQYKATKSAFNYPPLGTFSFSCNEIVVLVEYTPIYSVYLPINYRFIHSIISTIANKHYSFHQHSFQQHILLPIRKLIIIFSTSAGFTDARVFVLFSVFIVFRAKLKYQATKPSASDYSHHLVRFHSFSCNAMYQLNIHQFIVSIYQSSKIFFSLIASLVP